MLNIGTLLMVSGIYGSYGWAGGLSAAMGLAWAIGNPILSRLVDKHGQMFIMLPAAFISNLTLIWLIVAAVYHEPIGALFAPAIISGFTSGSAGSMARARWSHALGKGQQLHTAFALESTLDEICYIVGPMVATILATQVHPTAGLIVTAALALVGGVWFYWGLRSTQPPVTRQATVDTQSRVTRDSSNQFILKFGGLFFVVCVIGLFGLAFGAIDVSTVAATTTWGVRSMAGLVVGLMSLGSAVAGLTYGARHWKSPLANRFVIWTAIFAVFTTMLLLAHNVPLLILVGFFAGVGVAPTFTNSSSLVTRLVPEHRLTEGLAWVGTFIGLGASLGATVAGPLIDNHGYIAGYITAALGAVAALVMALIGWRSVRRHSAIHDSVN